VGADPRRPLPLLLAERKSEIKSISTTSTDFIRRTPG
jgi:hypothetical protein